MKSNDKCNCQICRCTIEKQCGCLPRAGKDTQSCKCGEKCQCRDNCCCKE